MMELDWLLSEDGTRSISEVARGNEIYLRYAIQICSLRNRGKFIKSYDMVEMYALAGAFACYCVTALLRSVFSTNLISCGVYCVKKQCIF